MRSMVALEAKEKCRERNNLLGPKFKDTSLYFLRWFQKALSTGTTVGLM